MRRRWQVFVLVAVCVAVAVVVAWWPRDEQLVVVESADAQGMCVRDVDGGERRCLAYTPELPSEARYRVGECLRLSQVYRGDVAPHATRVSCPGA